MVGKFEKVIPCFWPARLGAHFSLFHCPTFTSAFEMRQRLIHLHGAVLFLGEDRTENKTE